MTDPETTRDPAFHAYILEKKGRGKKGACWIKKTLPFLTANISTSMALLTQSYFMLIYSGPQNLMGERSV